MGGVGGSEGIGRGTGHVFSMTITSTFSHKPFQLFFKYTRLHGDQEGLRRNVVGIAEQGKLKSMFKADQGSMRLPFPGWLQKFLLEMYFFLQVQFFHFTREKNNFYDVGSHL